MDCEYLLSGFHGARTKGRGLFESSHADSLPTTRVRTPAEVRVGLHKRLDVVVQELLSHLPGDYRLDHFLQQHRDTTAAMTSFVT